jgi:hypothetical protein
MFKEEAWCKIDDDLKLKNCIATQMAEPTLASILIPFTFQCCYICLPNVTNTNAAEMILLYLMEHSLSGCKGVLLEWRTLLLDRRCLILKASHHVQLFLEMKNTVYYMTG